MAGALTIICALGLGLGFGAFGVVARPTKTTLVPPSASRLGIFRTAAVSTDGIPCSFIARDVLQEGGNAVDAAVAALFCVGLVNPHSTGIGGGFLMTIYNSTSKEAWALDAREIAPLAATEDMFHGNASISTKGPLAVAVPGEVAGSWEVHKKFGRLPWARLILPSIILARDGTRVYRSLAAALVERAEDIKREPTMWEFLNANGQVLQEGDIFTRPKLAETLQTLAELGGSEFYNGSIALKIVEDVQNRGGIITMEDMQAYRPVWRDPVKVKLNSNLTLYSIPPPGSGVLLGYILNILDSYWNQPVKGTKAKPDIRDPLVYHRITESFKHAYAQRTKLGDPATIPEMGQILANLTSEQYAADIRAKINDTATSNDPGFYGAVTYDPDDRGTSHISIVDQNGLAVSVTSTVNLYFGAGFQSSQTGIILNDEMDDFSSPNITNAFDVPPSPNNFIRPSNRPLSSMSGAILAHSDTGKIRIVVGAAGGTKITTAVALVIMRNLWFGQNIKEAIDDPRIHHQLFPMSLQYEEAFPNNLVNALENKGHNTTSYPTGAVVTAVSIEDDGYIYANSDFRKGGDVAGIDEISL